MLDAGSLAVLGQHFERVMGAIQNRVESVTPPFFFSSFPFFSSSPLFFLFFPISPYLPTKKKLTPPLSPPAGGSKKVIHPNHTFHDLARAARLHGAASRRRGDRPVPGYPAAN